MDRIDLKPIIKAGETESQRFGRLFEWAFAKYKKAHNDGDEKEKRKMAQIMAYYYFKWDSAYAENETIT